MITYIIKSGKYYTIGKTKNLKKRLRSYRTHNPVVEVIKIFDGDLEKDLHNRFQEKRIDKREWFILSKTDIVEINSTYNNIWKIKKPDIIIVPDKKTAFILRQIIIGKQVKAYNEFYNLPHKLDENFQIRTIYPDFIDSESWLNENVGYLDIVNSSVTDYLQQLKKIS